MTLKVASADLAHSFAPAIGDSARVLVLGSMPGRRSLAAQQYYAHPRNAFWPIMQALFGVDSLLEYPDRLRNLMATGVGLWDVLQECERPGSLDASIKKDSVVANDFGDLLARYPDIQAIFFNGAAAEQAFLKHVLPNLDDLHVALPRNRLPSTSPAHAALSVQQKTVAWRTALSVYLPS